MLKRTVLLTVVSLTLMASGVSKAQQAIIQADGSSTVFPITEAMAEEFQKANKGFKVTVGNSGTGGGFKKFCRGETDISNASRPIRDVEREDCKKADVQFIELPIALDALSVMVNPKNGWVKDMTVAELRMIWQPVLKQLKNVLDAYVFRDVEKALAVWRADENIDATCTSLFRELLTYMMEDPRNVTFCIHLMFCAKNIERMGDHATNIAETVYYVAEGRPIGDERPKGDTTMFASLPAL